ncbi:MAG: fumarylacetoacetate hydrolase family protein [Trueperaceae bacterium]|nr:fumarylacetoacetate hydrolase family protein [Trueperaceae bacterium]
MRFVRFLATAAGAEAWPRTGVVEGERVFEVGGDVLEPGARTGRAHDLAELRLLAPLVPRNVIGIGKNFVADGERVPEAPALPILFFKPISSVIGPDDAIVLPDGIDTVKFESELAVVMGRTVRGVSASEALDGVLGYTVANDLAAQEFHHPDGHWTISKSFDTFCPLGPAIETDVDLDAIMVEAYVNGERAQRAGLDRMITGVAEMIAYVSSFMTLSPGDVLLTGTPAGAGMVGHGDVVECAIEPIGRLRNPVHRSN